MKNSPQFQFTLDNDTIVGSNCKFCTLIPFKWFEDHCFKSRFPSRIIIGHSNSYKRVGIIVNAHYFCS